MAIINKIKEPVFLKPSSNAENQLDSLKALEPLLNAEGQAVIRQDIKNLEYGIIGENNIAYELKNSHMPMYILHDIYLEDGDLSAQIDYIVFTKKVCFIIECKNLYGNIEINNSGDFIRTIEYNGRKKKEGIYSPITQNQRHLELIRKIKVNNKNNFITKFLAERYFDDNYKSVVVLANPKTILNAKYAKKEVKDKVIRADQLVKYIKEMYNNSKQPVSSEQELQTWAQSFLDMHKEVNKNYSGKYDKYKLNSNISDISTEIIKLNKNDEKVASIDDTVQETELYKELKAYRLHTSREANIKPYFIYNDNQLKDLVIKRPTSKEELLKVAGFTDAKINKYGEDILSIISKH